MPNLGQGPGWPLTFRTTASAVFLHRKKQFIPQCTVGQVQVQSGDTRIGSVCFLVPLENWNRVSGRLTMAVRLCCGFALVALRFVCLCVCVCVVRVCVCVLFSALFVFVRAVFF